MRPKQLIVFDTTLRDGEQCPGASMKLEEKLRVARQLVRLGVDVIEAGFPVISAGDFAAVKQIAAEVKGPIIAGLARCLDRDIDAAGAAVGPAGERGRIHVFLATSEIHRKYKLVKAKSEIVQLAEWGVRRAKGFTQDVEFSPEDASRTEPDFLLDVCRVAIAAGATTLNIPDTVGWAEPIGYGKLIGRLHENLPECQSGKVVLSTHCHNDLGLAVVNSVAGFMAGASQIECTINGLGERAGNAALEAIIMLLKTRADAFGEVRHNIKTGELLRTSRLVARESGFFVPRNYPVVGENAFAHASGIHQDGVLKKRETYEIMDPEKVGWGASELPLTKHSGRAAIRSRLVSLGFAASEESLQAITAEVKKLGDREKEIYDDELAALADNHTEGCNRLNRFKLATVSVRSGAKKSSAEVRLIRLGGNGKKDFERLNASSSGDGPVDAAIKAIESLAGTHGKLDDYYLRTAGIGSDAVGEVVLRVDFGGGKLITGKGAGTDVVRASAQAYLNAVNRFLANGNP